MSKSNPLAQQDRVLDDCFGDGNHYLHFEASFCEEAPILQHQEPVEILDSPPSSFLEGNPTYPTSIMIKTPAEASAAT